MNYAEILADLGLSENEAVIYLAAIELGESLPKHLAEKASVKRSMLYKILPDLLSKELLLETLHGKRRYLIAQDPGIIVEKKKSEIKILEEKIPELRLLLQTASIKPKIVFYEGIEGLKKIYVDNLREKKPTLEFVSLKKIHPAMEAYSKNYYIPRRINKNIPIKIILSGETRSKILRIENDSYALREVKIISGEEFPLPIDCYIYGNNVSFLLYRSDSEPIGVIIRSQEIATTMRSLFNFIWQKA